MMNEVEHHSQLLVHLQSSGGEAIVVHPCSQLRLDRSGVIAMMDEVELEIDSQLSFLMQRKADLTRSSS